MNEKIREIENYLNILKEVKPLLDEEGMRHIYIKDVSLLLSHISTLEEMVKELKEGINRELGRHYQASWITGTVDQHDKILWSNVKKFLEDET